MNLIFTPEEAPGSFRRRTDGGCDAWTNSVYGSCMFPPVCVSDLGCEHEHLLKQARLCLVHEVMFMHQRLWHCRACNHSCTVGALNRKELT